MSGIGKEEERKKLVAHYTSDVKLLASVPVEAGVYALRYVRDGSAVAVAGEDGKVRIISAAEPKVLKEFVPAPIGPTPATAVR